jgi:hypothetical protein
MLDKTLRKILGIAKNKKGARATGSANCKKQKKASMKASIEASARSKSSKQRARSEQEL